MLALSRSPSTRQYTLIYVLQALDSIISICILHVILLSPIAPRYFTRLTDRIQAVHFYETGRSSEPFPNLF
jgi:hypothetical protein